MGLKNVIKKIVFAIYRCVVKVNTKQILFIPHKGFYVNDGASLKNYRSDNTLAFLRYILEENKLSDYNPTSEESVLVIIQLHLRVITSRRIVSFL